MLLLCWYKKKSKESLSLTTKCLLKVVHSLRVHKVHPEVEETSKQTTLLPTLCLEEDLSVTFKEDWVLLGKNVTSCIAIQQANLKIIQLVNLKIPPTIIALTNISDVMPLISKI